MKKCPTCGVEEREREKGIVIDGPEFFLHQEILENQRLRKKLTKALYEAEEAKKMITAGHWISVKDRLPDSERLVLCFVPQFGTVRSLTFHPEENHFGPDWMCHPYERVSHWMDFEKPENK